MQRDLTPPLVRFEAAAAALAAARAVDEVQAVSAAAERLRLYARQARDRSLLADATEIALRAERRLGELLAEARAAGMLARRGRPANCSEAEHFSPARLAEIGVDRKLAMRARRAAALDAAAFAAQVEGVRARILAGAARLLPFAAAAATMAARADAGDGLDPYWTPPWAGRALFARVLPALGIRGLASLWEPACGAGHLAEVAREYVPVVHASDIADYGYGEVADFLACGPAEAPIADWIVTNPPFSRALDFALHALDLAGEGVALFVRSQWAAEGAERYRRLFAPHPPTCIAFFAERVPLAYRRWDPDISTATAYCWLVWQRARPPRAPMWIAPGCAAALARADDRAVFTRTPVPRRQLAPAPWPPPSPAPAPPPWPDIPPSLLRVGGAP